jgi:hypothetical protein
MTPTLDLATLRAMPARVGIAPCMSPDTPQEQLDQFPSDWRTIEALAAHACALPNVIEQETRVAPDGSRAPTLAPAIPAKPGALMVGREFAHIHNPPTGSMHLMLPQPCRDLAIAKGWALRHPLAARGLGPAGAVFVFAPRDADELTWAKALLTVSYAWASGAIEERKEDEPT